MDATIFAFPASSIRAQAELQRVIRAQLDQAGATPDCIDFVCTRIARTQQKLPAPLSLHDHTHSSLSTEQVVEFYQACTSILIFDQVAVLVELYAVMTRGAL